MHSPVWTVADAKARLSEVLRRSRDEGPQRIGTRDQYVVVPAEVWESKAVPRPSLGEWLVEHMPRGTDLELPDRADPDRPVPFHDDAV